MKEKTKEKGRLWKLFLVFLRIGAFTFGGGYAMIPLIQKEVVENKKWITDDDILDIIAIAESTPGPIAINSATFIGFKVAGFWGSVCATAGVVLPSLFVIYIISFVLRQFQELRAVKYAFYGIRAGVLALVIKAWWTMYKKCPKNLVAYIIAITSFILVAVFDINIIFVLIGCALLGLITSYYKLKKEAKK